MPPHYTPRAHGCVAMAVIYQVNTASDGWGEQQLADTSVYEKARALGCASLTLTGSGSSHDETTIYTISFREWSVTEVSSTRKWPLRRLEVTHGDVPGDRTS